MRPLADSPTRRDCRRQPPRAEGSVAQGSRLKTTLKRGVGRSATSERERPRRLPAGPDQHDHALPAAAAAAALGPGAARPDPARRRCWRSSRSALAAAGGTYLWFHESVEALNATSPEVKKAQKKLDEIRRRTRPRSRSSSATTAASGDDPRHLALGHADAGARRPATDSISMLSFPRDLLVDIYCPGSHDVPATGSTRPTRAAGPKGTLETVSS